MEFTITIKQALEASGMKNVKEIGGHYYFEYKQNKIEMHQTEGGYDWNTYALKINEQTIATRVNFRTMIKKIKNYN